MKHFLTLFTLLVTSLAFGQESCPELWTACGEGTIWDEVSQKCIVANVSDTDFDECVGTSDFLVHLANFGSGCSPVSFFDCGDPLAYQGYLYETVLIGEQCWFAESLRSENYENGDAIPAGLDGSEWYNMSEGAVAVMGEIDSNLEVYGRLYNWYAVNDARGVCPSGWHVPSNGEWTVLTDHLGGESVAGYHMKADYGWFNGGNGTNSSGFSGLPGGYRDFYGDFYNVGHRSEMWSSTPYESDQAWAWSLTNSSTSLNSGISALNMGFSVRCIQDSEE
jgi:uncharacterized protein (TIGR02145 family)